MLLEILVLVLAIPIGHLIAWLARDELIAGRKWFKAIIFVSALIGSWFYIAGIKYITFTSLFIIITASISLIKSYDKRWTKRAL
ncbi:MAG: hypothetical protein AABX73_00360 [Nanoarchaeota archaeon]